MTEVDSLARPTGAVSGTWTHDHITVTRSAGLSVPLSIVTAGSNVLVQHSLEPQDLSESLVSIVTEHIGRAGLSQRDFELVMVGLVRSTIDDPLGGWTQYYRNSLDQLVDGSADFAPIHERAQHYVIGSVLDLGSCFGFFPLRLALAGTSVVASDLSAGTMRLLSAVAPTLDADITTLVCNAGEVPRPDKSVDTVTALHLLEHVDADTGRLIIIEALRLARQRVVIAVPYEDEATTCHGHIRTFDANALRAVGMASGAAFSVTEHHGGWLILNPAQG